MRQLVLTPKFKRAHRKFIRRNKKLEQYIVIALRQNVDVNKHLFRPQNNLQRS